MHTQDHDLTVPPHVSPEELLKRPLFGVARGHYIESTLATYVNRPFLSHLFGDYARQLVAIVTLRLDALQVEDDPETWLTPRIIQRTIAASGVMSARTVTTRLSRLRETGYLTSEVAAADRRQRILRPTAKMLDFYTEWSLCLLRPLAVLMPRPEYRLGLSGDPAFMLAQRRAGARVLDRTMTVLTRNPEVMLFFGRDAGFLLLAMLERSAADGGGVAEKPYAEAARRFGISRTHARKVLEAAQAAGLVEIRAPGGRAIVHTQRLQHALDRYVADMLSITDLIFAIASGRTHS